MTICLITCHSITSLETVVQKADLSLQLQPRPFAAIELIHKQPVRWIKGRSASCDGGGGPLGHPRIFINVDKPQICWCTYCGVPYVSAISVDTLSQ